MSIALHPLNDFAVFARLKQIDSETGAVSALTEGSVSAFLATSNAADAAAADATLVATGVHVSSGKWLIFIDGSVLTLSLLESLFAAATPYLIVQQPGGIRVYAELEYSATREATVE